MNIVFWGETRQCGTTANLIATVGALSAICPQRTSGIGRKSDFNAKKPEFHFYDGGSGITERKRRMLWHADLVAVNLSEDAACLERYVCTDSHLARRTMIFLGSYCGDAEANRAYLEWVYRIPREQVIVIPYNNEFHHAMLNKSGRMFVERELLAPANQKNERFVEAFGEAARFILRTEKQIAVEKEKKAYLIKEAQTTVQRKRRKELWNR